jgi:hypothetical protein
LVKLGSYLLSPCTFPTAPSYHHYPRGPFVASLKKTTTASYITFPDLGIIDAFLYFRDTAPHSNSLNQKELNSLIKETTDLLNKTFNGSYIIPVLGNHDVIPSGQMPPNNTAYYKGILKDWGWEKLLHDDEKKTFVNGKNF